MPGPLAGTVVPGNHDEWKAQGFAFADHRAGPMYVTAHAKCEKGAQCNGPGCRANTGKTRRQTRFY